MAKVIWNHITARVPNEPDRILVLRMGCRFDEVTASNLVKLTLDGEMVSKEDGERHTAAYVVHGASTAPGRRSCASCTPMRGAARVSPP